MGKLIKQGKLSTYSYHDSAGNIYKKKTGNYKNMNAVDNLIRYITRTRQDESRFDELKYWNAIGFDNTDVSIVIQQFTHVQSIMRDHTIRKAYHFTYSPDQNEKRLINKDYCLAALIAYNQALLFYNAGFQTVVAVHDTIDGNLHFHFVLNSVNYINGKMFHFSISEDQSILEASMTTVSYNLIAVNRGLIYPFVCQDIVNPSTIKALG